LFRGEFDAVEAAKKITEDVNASRTAAQAEDRLWRMWHLVADVAAKFPQYHDKMVEMVKSIHTLPILRTRAGEEIVKWVDLPILGETWAETVFNCMSKLCYLLLLDGVEYILATKLLTQHRERDWRFRFGYIG
jgi:flavoprotein